MRRPAPRHSKRSVNIPASIAVVDRAGELVKENENAAGPMKTRSMVILAMKATRYIR